MVSMKEKSEKFVEVSSGTERYSRMIAEVKVGCPLDVATNSIKSAGRYHEILHKGILEKRYMKHFFAAFYTCDMAAGGHPVDFFWFMTSRCDSLTLL